MATPKVQQLPPGAVRPRFLGYRLPNPKAGARNLERQFEQFELSDVQDAPSISFLSFDGVVVFGGAFEEPAGHYGGDHLICSNPADLDLREREFFTAFEKNRTLIFLVPAMPTSVIGYSEFDPSTDLFRRFMDRCQIGLAGRTTAIPHLSTSVPEFNDYVSRFGTGYVQLLPDPETENLIAPLCTSSDEIFGFSYEDRLFVLPSPTPQSSDHAIEIVESATNAVISYRRRIDKSLPAWTADFSFHVEAKKRSEADELHKQALDLEADVNNYVAFKGALCFQSTPLVELVSKVFDHFFKLNLTVEDKRVEDATLWENGSIVAVFEIKGVKGSFVRQNVNQLDSHRERLGVPASVPGILVMNTVMSAETIEQKDQAPHPDIIKKAVADNVLLIRTLDLLRYADCVDRGALQRDSFRQMILTKSGWLKVDNDSATVVTG